jgi:DNA-binding transcriptional LysR family regulator
MIRRIQLLRYFLAVARSGSIRQAADSVHLSQPALTRRIQDLESDLGVTLFERTPRGMALTRFGEVVLHHAQAIDTSCDFALKEINDLATGETGELRIGTGPAWAFSLVPDTVAQLRNALPRVKVQFFDWVNERMLPMLLEGQLDILVGGIPPEGERQPQLQYEPLFDVEQLVFAGNDHPLQGRTCSARHLTRYPWIWFREATLGRALLRRQFDEQNIPWPESAIDTTSIHFGMRLLGQGNDYLMLLPSTLVEAASGLGVKPLRLQQALQAYPAGLMYREQVMRLRAAAMFRELLAQRVAALRAALRRRR